MLENLIRDSLLLDFYGELLPEKQREFFRLYYEENCSLQEIADDFGLSRQGVHDAVKKAEGSLAGYEDKLGLVERFMSTRRILDSLSSDMEELMAQRKDDAALGEKLSKMRKKLQDLEI